MLALRLYDSFLSRFPLSVKCRGIEHTAADIILGLPPSSENVEVLSTYLCYHTESLLAPRVGAWLSNAERRLA